MRDYIRYVLRGREGLRSYLVFLGVVFGGIFVIMLVLLGVFVAEKVTDRISMMLYEVLGTGAAAIGFTLMTDRLLRISASMGVSRRSFLRTTAFLSPLLALLTTAVVALFFVITDGVYRLGGSSLAGIGNVFGYYDIFYEYSAYQPRMAFYSLALVFCIALFLYTFALLYVGLKWRFNRPAAAIVTGISLFFCYFNIIDSYFMSEEIVRAITEKIDPDYMLERYGAPIGSTSTFSYWDRLLVPVALAVIWYLVMYAVFVLLMRRTAVCGKEEEGLI